ncbi:hypothetical protein BO83DRAFT_406874 [Aspergillus eucalypticola CBS 122712]|uniref:Uncharacterized protein n=1 Tax=Aspergillus eucalypticola (strain CBS 122712 / IBT 29274) TaxID=1448314 RepID=A0A317VVJ6_ASPEC|nr:uncharacterized protein BO83DRAFT_406874 [Aspergillus eucalypticola CBS 122712]PWY77825.1 hypothetical protein BO83DRAFT_406874 [Aspergillus eucalypticola CBS 122712]
MDKTKEPIAIVGSACRFPGGCDTPSKLWEMLKQQRNILQKIPKDRFNTDPFYHPEPTHHGTSNAQFSYLLEQDIGEFDANFFNILPKEAECIDPQQRLLMETVYDGITAAGLPMEKLRGSNTAVYVGQMCDDWPGMLQTQLDESPPYMATGSSRSIVASRVSYFFDWHGPCMNIDTACSSSLVAIHEAVQTLRSGQSGIDVAAGVNILISPMYYISESNLRMLSSEGRCRMWDAAGDGYGRGEGIACVVLKTLSQAQRDNDHIECIIRETGVNQDGRTSGITMPSNIAQAQLIRDTYRRAGLDVHNPLDQPQFFHAHGTGTKAGDPQEATAIYHAFFTKETEPEQKLLVGSIKTHIGHTEGAAGLASHGQVPPNLHFNELNPDIQPFYGAFEVPTSVKEWPALKPAQVRRASVNSFGFGGTNAHAIMESYVPPGTIMSAPSQSTTLYTPLLFSANSIASLREMISRHRDYLVDRPETSLRDLAWTLQHHRSTLPYRKAITGRDYESIIAQMGSVLHAEPADLSVRSTQSTEPRLLAVFTGQGAQWPRMGARLLESSSFVRDKIAFLDECLATLPEDDRPDWTISDQILATGESSRVLEAAISQPLCTAVQIVLVDLLQAAGIKLDAVVGHSSGEIGAAYAAGLLSTCDAIRVAYLRGVCAKLAASPSGAKGGMAAVGVSAEDVQEVFDQEEIREEIKGKISIAALNSGSSITLSGDEDVVQTVVDVCTSQGKFARRLRVDTAYHSDHMLPCANPYLEAMERCGISVQQPLGDRPACFSSVYRDTIMDANNLTPEYWVHNMVQTVLFLPAITRAAKEIQTLDIAIEVGPHPALKGPALDSLGEVQTQIPYTGLLGRGKNDIDELSAAVGYLWTQLGSGVVDFDGLESALAGDKEPKTLLVDLPSYPFDHQNRYWVECRTWKANRLSDAYPNTLLGSCLTTTRSPGNAQWKNILKPTEIPWLQGHRLQNQLILPATAYIVMALEAIKAVAGHAAIALFRLTDLVLKRPIVFDDDSSSIECISNLQILAFNDSHIKAQFTVESAPQGELSLRVNVEGSIEVELGRSNPEKLPLLEHDDHYNINEQNPGRFYSEMRNIGYHFLQAEGIVLAPFSPAQAQDDNQLLGHIEWLPALPNGANTGDGKASVSLNPAVTRDVERISLYYLRKLCEMSTPKHRSQALPHHQQLLKWAASVIDRVSVGKHPFIAKEWISDSEQLIEQLSCRHPDSVEAKLVAEIGPSLPDLVHEQGILAHYISMNEEAPTIKRVHERLADLVKQINHRYAHMHILGNGSGNGAMTEMIVSSLGTSFSSYTFTDVSDNLFSEAEFRFYQYADRMIFKTFDMYQDPTAQGFTAGTYDLVLVGNGLQTARNQEQVLSNIRQLLKPGGYLISASPLADDSLRLGLIMSDCPEYWNNLLGQCQFSGIDTCTPVEDVLHDIPVWAAQAEDERVRLLRNPLGASVELPDEMPPLVIIGGRSLATVQLVEQIAALLSTKFPVVTRLHSLEALITTSIPSKATVLSLADLDGLVMKLWTANKLEALKLLWNQAARVLWVTKVVRMEKIDLNVQLLDVDSINPGTACLVCETFLKHQLLLTWSPDNSTEKLLWSYENEVAVEGQQTLIPRLYSNEVENMRFNSVRRPIVHEVNPFVSTLRLASTGESYQLEEVSSLRVAVTLPTIRVCQSILQFLKLGSNGSFMLCIGTRQDDSQAMVSALTQYSESPAPVEPGWEIELPFSPEVGRLALMTVATHIVTQQMLAMVPKNGTLVVHEPDNLLHAALLDAAEKDRLDVWFTTCQPGRNSNWTYLHPALPARLVKEKMPSEVSAFVNLEAPNGLGARVADAIAGCVPPHGVHASATTFFANQLYTRSGVEPAVLRELLQNAWQSASTSSLALELIDPIPLGEVSFHNPVREAIQLVDWNVPSVPVHLRQIDADPIFRRDRTYLMIGLTGEVGQSLCHWMARKGAGCIVLASRNPKVTPAFLRKAEDLGATVRPLSLDITCRDSLQRCLREIRRSMPPIAGVANGAMIMEDVQFDHVEFESMERSMKPKVLGSKLLDEAFYDTALDFFIMFSSIAGVVGNTGQSTYAAANMYMAGLALNRRKRGVVGSVIAYSPLMGLGYIDRTDETMGDKFLSMGVSLMSETDFRYAFAEAIKEGQASCHDRGELITGCAPKVLSDITRNRYRSDIRFSHINLERVNGQAGAGAGDSSIRGLLKQAVSMEEVEGVVLNAFTARLKTLLRMSTEQPLDVNSSLVAQGIDSLVAIDIREWFDRELEIDMPVIKILGGSSIVTLIKGCLQDIPETVVDIRNLSNEDQSVGGKPAAPAAVTSVVESAIPLSESKDLISSSSDSESVDTSSHYGTSDTEPEEESTCEPSIDLDLRQSTIQSATEKVVPMSFGQARFWFMQHALQDPSALNMGRCWHIEGVLDLPRLRKAVITVADRHEAMRTRFFWGGEDHDVPMQGILSRSIVQLETKRITNKEEVNRELDAMRHHAYDLGDWQLVRTRLLTLSNREHYMIIGNHPITFDDSSASLLLDEMNQAYLGQSLPSLPQEAQYSFFAEAQFRDYKEGRFQKHIDYFKALIKEENHPLELFAFSKAPARPVQTQYRTHRSDMRLSSKQASLLKQISQDRHSATSDLYTAVLGVLLFRLLPNTNQVLLGIDADRNDLALGRSMGCAHNALPVRLERPGINTKLGPYLDTVRNAIEGVLEHSAVPFDVLVNELKLDRSANVPPVFQAMIQHCVERQDQVTWCNATCNPDKSLNSCTGLDLYLDITENCAGETAVGLEVQQGLYSQEHADLLVKSFVYLLEQLTRNLDVPLATSELWPPEDISRALELGTGPVAPMKWPRTVVHRIDQMIQQNGSNLALKDGSGKSLTYNDMGRRIDSIIAALRQAGTPKGSVIGVMQEPSVDSICSMLAVFRVGAVYMPFDHRISIDRAQGAIHKANLATRQHIPRTPNLADGSSPAIILLTGGSTFEPSLVKHASIIPQLEASSMQYNFSNERPLVALQHSANSTDLSLTQTLDVLCNGGSLIILPANRQGDPVEIAKTMQEENISYTLAAPSEYQNWLSCAAEQLRNCPRWTLAITTGEGVPQKLLQSFRALDSPSLQLLNLYSPVGTCFGSTWQGLVEYRKSDAKSPVAAGYASPNQAIYIVDVELRPLPVGVPGEVLIGGAGIADCYGNMYSTMKERFIESPFSQRDSNFTTNKWETVYRTGDRGYLQKDGALVLVGRSDGATQVNVRGFQVDLEEVENALIEASGGFLTNAAVTLREHGEDQFLAAHVVFSNPTSQKNSQEMLLDNLLMRLPVPDYMVPSAIVVLEEMPLDSHYRVDRTAICQLPIDESNVVTPTSREMTSTETSLAEVWKGVLCASATPTLTPSSDFFQVGGTSLLIVILQRAIKEQYKVALPVTELVATKRLADMARLIEGKGVFV